MVVSKEQLRSVICTSTCTAHDGVIDRILQLIEEDHARNNSQTERRRDTKEEST